MSKKIENVAFAQLQAYIGEHLPDSSLRPTMNKGRGEHPDLADAVLEHQGRTYHIEIKASSKKVGYNIRFTHQTVTKAVGKDLIVALISDVETGSPSFEFFRLSDVAQNLCLEPHFLIAKKNAKDKCQQLNTILSLPDATLNIANLLDSQVRDHTRLRYPSGINPSESVVSVHDHAQESIASDLTESEAPLWTPFPSSTDSNGYPYPPWLKYPNLPMTSMGWRMGEGESYSEDFHDWLTLQPADVLLAYQTKYPAPPGWSDIWPREHDA